MSGAEKERVATEPKRTHLGRRSGDQVVLLAVRIQATSLALLLELPQVVRLWQLLRLSLLARSRLLLFALALLALSPPLLEEPLGLGLPARFGCLCGLLGFCALLLDAGVLCLLAGRVDLGPLEELVELCAWTRGGSAWAGTVELKTRHLWVHTHIHAVATSPRRQVDVAAQLKRTRGEELRGALKKNQAQRRAPCRCEAGVQKRSRWPGRGERRVSSVE